MDLVEMGSKEQVLMRNFAHAIRFNMQPFRAGSFIISYEKFWVSDSFYVYKLQIQLKGGDLVLTHHFSEEELLQAFHPDDFAIALARDFSKKFREYRQEPGTNIVLGEN